VCIVSPYAPGCALDAATPPFVPKLTEALGQQVITPKPAK
jgi:hypothetical protein